MRKRLIIIGIIVLIAAGAGVLVWQRSAKPVVNPTSEELGKQMVELEKQIAAKQAEIDSIEQQLKDLSKEYTPEKEAKRKRHVEIFTSQNISDDVPVEGVEIVKTGNKKVIKNHAQGYSIEIPLDLVLARSVYSDKIELYKRTSGCENCKPDITIGVRKREPDELPLNEEAEANKGFFEKIVVQGMLAYKVKTVVPDRFNGYYYKWERDQKIYYIEVNHLNDQKYFPFIETFKFE